MTKRRENTERGIAFNVAMLYIMNISKLIFPLITLPYLTRVLSVETYGVVSYVKATMVYAQLIVDFGFLLSGVKAITENRDDRDKLGKITGNIVFAKLLLAIVSGVFIGIFSIFIPILRENPLFVFLSLIPVILTIFLFDFLFRGIEQMHIITIRYVLMKAITVGLTLIFVKSDRDMMLIPVLDIIGSLAAIALVIIEVRKLGIKLNFSGRLKGAILAVRESALYFISDAATTVFGALNTVIIGIFMSKTDVAYWAVCLQLVNAVKAMYTPVTNGIYPRMIQTKDLRIIKKSLQIFMPLIVIGCVIVLIFSENILTIVGSIKYVGAAQTMRCLVPVLFFCFPAMLFGWPCLGAINKVADTTKTTIAAACVQIVGLSFIAITGNFSLISVALVKSFTEMCLMAFRLRYCYRYRNEFRKG